MSGADRGRSDGDESIVFGSARMRAALERANGMVAADPRLAAVCASGGAAEIPAVRASHNRLVEDLTAVLRAGRAESPRGQELPEILEPALVGAAVYLVGRSIVDGDGRGNEALIAELAEVMTMPYRA